MSFGTNSGTLKTKSNTPPPTDLSGSEFFHAKWSFTNLQGVAMRGADFTGSRFVHSELGAADLSESTLFNSSFDCSNLDSASFDGSSIRQGSFIGARLESASFRKATFADVDFTGARLGCADFTGAKFDTSWSDAQIRLVGTDLRRASGISDDLWARACIGKGTRLPSGAPPDLPVCPASERELSCINDNGQQRINLSDLLTSDHFFYSEIKEPILAELTKQGVEVIDNMTVKADTQPTQPPPEQSLLP